MSYRPEPSASIDGTARHDELTAAAMRFAIAGYGATSLDDIAAACGSTRAALRHRYPSKAVLFEAVFEREQADVCEEVMAAYLALADPRDAARAALARFLDVATKPARQRILFVDARTVLGWERMRSIEARHGLAVVERALSDLMAAGWIAAREVEPLAHIFFGALCEGATVVAHARDQERCAHEVGREIDRLLIALLVTGDGSPGNRSQRGRDGKG